MPLNRYGGYGGYGGSYSSYSSSYSSSYGRAGSASPATLRAATPSRAFGSNSIINTILPEDRTFKLSSYYSPSSYSRIYLNDYEKRDLKTIKTEELETSVENRENTRNHAIPGEITRDTTLNIRGGKPVVRIVTQKAKENPYINNPGWRSRVKEEEEKNSLTLGQRLALKHQIAEKPKQSEKSTNSPSRKAESGEESEWTWETCSSSSQEQDGYEYTLEKPPVHRVKTPPPTAPARRTPVVYSKSNTTALCSTEDNKTIKPSPSTPATPNSAVRNRWLESLADSKPKATSERIPNFGSAVSMNKNLLGRQLSSGARPVSWAGSQPAPPSSSGSSSSSPPLYKYNPSKTSRQKTIISSSDEDEARVDHGWRPGQPPRGEVVVKLTNNKKKSVIDSQHSNAKLTNQVLTSDKVISSKVPGNMNEKYSIPGLFIKPSTKVAPKSVEAKLTLSPVEGTFSLTTKVKDQKEKGSYQSSIFTPTKSPVLDSRSQVKSTVEPVSVKSDDKHLPGPVSSVCLSSVVETGAQGTRSEEESEWEYYTETEPSDTEEAKKESQTSPANTKTEKADDSKTKESVLPHTISSPQNSNNVLSVPAIVSKASKSKPHVEKRALDVKPVESAGKNIVSEINIGVKNNQVETKVIPASKKTQDKVESNNNVRNSKEVNNTTNDIIGLTGVTKKPADPAQMSDNERVKLQNKTEIVENKNKGRPTDLKIDQNVAVDNNKAKPLVSLQKYSKLTENISSEVKPPADSKKKNETKSGLEIKSDSTAGGNTENSKKVTTFDDQKVKTIPVTTDASKVKNIATPTEVVKNDATEKIKNIPITTETVKNIPVRDAPDNNNKKSQGTTDASKVKNIPIITNTSKVKSLQATTDSSKVKNIPITTDPSKVKNVPATTDVLKVKDITTDASNVKNIPIMIESSNVKSIPIATDGQKDTNIPANQKKINEQTNDKAAAVSKSAEEADLIKEKEYKSESRTSSPENNMPATSLERLPSPLKNMFSGTVSPKSSPENAPKWYNNTPTDDPNFINPTKAITQMKNDVNKQVEKQIRQEKTLIKISDKPDSPWYNEEDDDMKDLLQKRPSILKEIDLHQDRRLTPEENMAVIKMYGGVMFPGGFMEKTPKNLLFKIRKTGRNESLETQKLRDSGFESQRTNSTGSNSSTISSFTTFSQTPSPAHSDESDDSSDSGDDEKIKKNPINQAPTKSRPEFKKYLVRDFRFLKVLGKGSFGKVLLAELRNTQNYYAVKALRKDSILEDDDIECTMIERKVLALGVKHPFLCHLFCTLQTDSHLFFVMEYLNGGDLMFHIQQSGRFETERARFYSAEIVCALKFLHKKGIVYRDLKLDNLLLDYEGHIRLVDFGMCKLQIYLDKTSDTFCGTPDYMAPEIIKGMKYTHSVDWWSFGVLLYEMLIGQSPFNGCDEDELFWSICNEQAYFPRFLSKEAKAILLLLLEKNPAKRLGVSESFHGEIRHQPFFKPIDFVKLEKKQISPPYKPKLKNPMDVSYFDTAFTDEPVKLTPVESDFLKNLNQVQFKGFSYTNRQYTTQLKS